MMEATDRRVRGRYDALTLSLFGWLIRYRHLRLVRMIPNILSTIRLTAPYFIWKAYGVLADGGKPWLWFTLLGLLAITDFIDGSLARHLGVVSSYGKAMDPLADKVFVLPSMLALVYLLPGAVYLMMVFVFSAVIDLTGMLINTWRRLRGLADGANRAGKRKLNLQMLAISCGFAAVMIPAHQALLTGITSAFAALAVQQGVISLQQYLLPTPALTPTSVDDWQQEQSDATSELVRLIAHQNRVEAAPFN